MRWTQSRAEAEYGVLSIEVVVVDGVGAVISLGQGTGGAGRGGPAREIDGGRWPAWPARPRPAMDCDLNVSRGVPAQRLAMFCPV